MFTRRGLLCTSASRRAKKTEWSALNGLVGVVCTHNLSGFDWSRYDTCLFLFVPPFLSNSCCSGIYGGVPGKEEFVYIIHGVVTWLALLPMVGVVLMGEVSLGVIHI